MSTLLAQPVAELRPGAENLGPGEAPTGPAQSPTASRKNAHTKTGNP
jgi:hypothetical protein